MMSNLPRIVFFDFDSYVVKDEFRSTVEANAKVLSADAKKVTIEGHTDERGGRGSTSHSARSVPRPWPSRWRCSGPPTRRWKP